MLELVASVGLICADPHWLHGFLRDRYEETPKSVGQVDNADRTLLVYESHRGTWTLVLLYQDRRPIRACVIGTGQGWEDLRESVRGEPT